MIRNIKNMQKSQKTSREKYVRKNLLHTAEIIT